MTLSLWRIQLLGGLRAQRGEHIITRFRTQKAAALLAFLAFSRERPHTREQLIDLLWPEADLDAGRNSLSVALSTLRGQLEPPGTPASSVIRADRFSVGLNASALTTDVAEFEEAVQAARSRQAGGEQTQRWADAVALYSGPLLPGFYDEWITAEQARLSGLYFDAATALIRDLEQSGDVSAALEYARRVVAADTLREEAHLQLMRLLASAGQPGAALRQYREMERLLEEELGDEPSVAARSLAREIERRSGLSAPAPPRPAAPVPASASTPAVLGGTVTFLLTDIAQSTRQWERTGPAFQQALQQHHRLLRDVFSRHQGREVQEAGDGFLVAFATAKSALAAACAAQQALAAHAWPVEVEPLAVRMALHTGDVEVQDGGYRSLVLHRLQRMASAGHGGQILVSEATMVLVRRDLDEQTRLLDLGVYRLRDLPAPERLFQVEYPEMAQRDFPALTAQTGVAASLPPQFTRFFGRQPEIERLTEWLLLPETRLVTLTGPGGSGKTRLALEVARRLVEALQGAVWFVPLADVSDPSLIPGALVDALRLPRAGRQEPLDQAVEALSRQASLLVVDNMEQLVEGGAPIVQTLLTRVPALTLLVTSRRLLGLSAEREFPVGPLSTPDGADTPENLSLFDSVQLFIDRAQMARPYFQITNHNAAAVAALCDRLEGIPLAIELCAARASVMTPSQMLAQLSHRFDLLVSRKRDDPERHRTLRAALDWSYRLLSPELQRFFTRLSVFRGGWSAEAAEAVCEEPLALDLLAQLQDSSLVRTEETETGMRFRMLESLREYAQAQSASEEAAATQRRHVDYFLHLAEEARLRQRGAEAEDRLDRLYREHDNLRAALQWCRNAPDEGERELRLAGSLWHFWMIRGYLSEGRGWLTQALERAGDAASGADPRLRADALMGAGSLAEYQGDYAVAQACYQECLALCRDAGDAPCIAEALSNLGLIAQARGDYAGAAALHEESAALRRQANDRAGIAVSLINLGSVALQRGDYAQARALREESLAISRELGNQQGIAVAVVNLGTVAYLQGDFAGARRYYEESLALSRARHDKRGIAVSLHNLGDVAQAERDDAAASARYKESLALFRELGDRPSIAYSLERVGGLLAARPAGAGAARAAQLLAADALRSLLGSPLPPHEQSEHAASFASVRATLGEADFQAWSNVGRGLSWEQAVSVALEESSPD